MKKIIFSDTHFGAHQNSMVWLDSQVSFFENQFIPYIENLAKKEEIVIYCLGDVFDVRSGVNSKVAQTARDIFKKISRIASLYVIGGNHDYYSPVSDTICSLDLFLSNIDNLTLVTHEPLKIVYKNDTRDILIPWYIQESLGIDGMCDKYSNYAIYTHTDLVSKPKYYQTHIYSGHIHTPLIEPDKNLYNLGSCFGLTFADSNTERGFYIVYDKLCKNSAKTSKTNLEFIPNNQSIRFWRSFDSDPANNYKNTEWLSKIKPCDYIEIYVPQETLYSDYEVFEELKETYNNLQVIPQNDNKIYESVDIECDIDKIICENIPDYLREPYTNIMKTLNFK